MKRYAVLSAIVALLVISVLAVHAQSPDMFKLVPNKAFRMNIPKVNFSAAQVDMIKNKKPVCLLLPSPSNAELKAGYMAAKVPFDPVTVWWIVCDIRHFHLTDPSYPSSGSITDKRRTFMPYVRDGVVCQQNGQSYLWQLLVMPFVDPRTYSLSRHPNRNGFPWESAWSAMSELVCSDKRNHEFDSYFNSAVQVKHNNGCWHIQPVPPQYRTGPEDAYATYIDYYVDTNPGGNIGQIKSIVNKATSTALPALHQNIMFHGQKWMEHMKKFHSAAEVAEYQKELAAFKASVGQ